MCEPFFDGSLILHPFGRFGKWFAVFPRKFCVRGSGQRKHVRHRHARSSPVPFPLRG
jgi:hypothetical protein